jgi:preprotein translocase SecF subunit
LEKTIDFLKYKYVAFAFSLILLCIFIIGTVSRGGMVYGIDFAGGTKIVAQFKDPAVNEGSIREALSEYSPTVQQIGEAAKNEYIITFKLIASKSDNKVPGAELEKQSRIKADLNAKFPGVVIESEENVGPAIGAFLKKSAIKLFVIALILMTLYLTFRFEFKYSMGTMGALVHDVVLSLAFCGFAGVEISIPVIAALLTIFGYSVNDTIVIFDRIRENTQVKSKEIFSEVVNKSITQSVSRTLLTSLTTLFAVMSLYLLGGDVLNDFALVLLFGIFIGTYSTVYLASPILTGWEKMRSR